MCSSRRGFTLIEVVVLIVVIGLAMTGVLLIFQNTVRKSADPQIYKQSLAIAEAMLDEALLAPYGPVTGGSGGVRENFNDVTDYGGFNSNGVTDMQGVAVPGLGDYDVAVVVAPEAALAGVPESRRVTVTVTHPRAGVSISLEGYRIRYAGP
jgi:MSHA pilin protein MshD